MPQIGTRMISQYKIVAKYLEKYNWSTSKLKVEMNWFTVICFILLAQIRSNYSKNVLYVFMQWNKQC
jgi:hypothetical protein